MNDSSRNTVAIIGIAAVTLALAACASGPKIRTDVDRSADFSRYHTYAFASELGTDRSGYSTLVTNYFKQAVGKELQTRGYHYDEENPDLIVNFNARTHTRTDVISVPQPAYSAGYYGYRHGLYSAWPMYAHDIEAVTYKVGTANVDLVDVERNQLVWEGVAEGELTEKALDDPSTAIGNAVAKMFEKYPASAGQAAVFDSR